MSIIDGKSYEKAIEYINSLSQFVAGTGCERAEKLLERLGNPQDKLKVIHVAGSNGKGSVCAYLAGILQENGYKTGLFTSPHLIDERERIRINGMMITKEEFAEAYARVKAVEDELGKGSLAYFDYFLGIAFIVFLKQNVDICVIETGLGGRLDATNAVKNPVLDIIATISLEHTAILGDTIEKIAEESNIKDIVPIINIDTEIDLNNINKDIVKSLSALEPFGEGNKMPLFAYRNLKINSIRALSEGKHLKLTLKDNNNIINAIGFNMGYLVNDYLIGDKVDVVGVLEINTFNGVDNLQINLKDIMKSI